MRYGSMGGNWGCCRVDRMGVCDECSCASVAGSPGSQARDPGILIIVITQHTIKLYLAGWTGNSRQAWIVKFGRVASHILRWLSVSSTGKPRQGRLLHPQTRRSVVSLNILHRPINAHGISYFQGEERDFYTWLLFTTDGLEITSVEGYQISQRT